MPPTASPTHICRESFAGEVDGEAAVFRIGDTHDDHDCPLNADHPAVRAHPGYFSEVRPGEKTPTVDEIYLSEARAARRYGLLIDVDQGAELLGLDPETVRRQLRNGKLPGVKVAAGTPKPQWRIIKSSLDRWMAADARARTTRLRGVVVGRYGDHLAEQIWCVEAEMAADESLTRRLADLDEGERIEARAQELARRIRADQDERARTRARAAEILAEEDA